MTQSKPSRTYDNLLDDLPSLGYMDDDIHAHLQAAAKSNIQDIIDIQAEHIRKASGTRTLPAEIWEPLWRYAHKICAEHCRTLAKELEEESLKDRS